MLFHSKQSPNLNYELTRDLFDAGYRSALMKNLDKNVYETRLESFRQRFDVELCKLDSGERFVEDVVALTAKKGKLSSLTKSDVGLYLIYFVLPTLELSATSEAAALLNSIVNAWRIASENPNFGYESYELVKEGFRTTILGVPLENFGKRS